MHAASNRNEIAEQLLKQKVRTLGNRCTVFGPTSRLGVKITSCLFFFFACVDDDYAKRRTETSGADGGKVVAARIVRIARTFALNSWSGIGARLNAVCC